MYLQHLRIDIIFLIYNLRYFELIKKISSYHMF